MSKENKNVALKIGAGIIGSLVIGAGIGALVADDSSQVQDMQTQAEVLQTAIASLENNETTLNEVAATKDLEIFALNAEALESASMIVNLSEQVTSLENATPEVIEDVDTLKLVCNKAMYDDLTKCKNEVTAEDSALQLAFEEIVSEFVDEDFLEDLEDDGLVEDKDEVDFIRVYEDYEDITIVKSDFDDEEYKFKILVKIDDEEADEKKFFNVTVVVEDNEAEITKVVLA